MKLIFKTIFLFSFSLIMLNSCEQAEEVVSDVQKTIALRNVEFSYDSVSTGLEFPEGSLSGKTFQELLENNRELYSDPANYSVKIRAHYTANNNKETASDAMFSGMLQDIVLSNITDAPVQLETPAFEVPKNEILNISSNSTISLGTHKSAVLYIFNQILADQDLDAEISSRLNYEVGLEKGSINLGKIQKNIPIKVSADTKKLISGILESDLFDE